jgi:hypothetical protein
MTGRARGQRWISAAELRAECTLLERAVRSAHCATDESLAPHRPGGERNPGRDARAWLAYYRHLHRIHAVGTYQPAAGGPAETERALLAALRSEPVRVELSVTDADGTPRAVFVHPKSAHCLLHLSARDRVLAWLAERAARLGTSDRPDDLPLFARVNREMAYQLAVFASIVCHPGPGSPYHDDAERPEPAPWALELNPVDVARIVAAHLEVNSQRLAALSALVSARHQDGGPVTRSWGVFFGYAASELHVASDAVMRDRSLASVLAQLATTGAARTEALEPSAHTVGAPA